MSTNHTDNATDKEWYLFNGKEQEGPFTHAEIFSKIQNKQLKADEHLFCIGWQDWKTVKDCPNFQAALIPPPPKLPKIPPPPKMTTTPPPTVKEAPAVTKTSAPTERRQLPRACIAGQVIVHNQKDLSVGQAANISIGGVYIKTEEQHFKEGQRLLMTCKITGLEEKFQAKGIVMHYKDSESGRGYGIQFVNLDSHISDIIKQHLDKV